MGAAPWLHTQGESSSRQGVIDYPRHSTESVTSSKRSGLNSSRSASASESDASWIRRLRPPAPCTMLNRVVFVSLATRSRYLRPCGETVITRTRPSFGFVARFASLLFVSQPAMRLTPYFGAPSRSLVPIVKPPRAQQQVSMHRLDPAGCRTEPA